MSSKRTRDGKTSRWDAEESSRGRMHRPEEIRPVRKGPAGLIFMCNSSTKKDCFQYRVLGLPLAKKELVEQIEPGALLFLFDINVRELHGIFEASSHGGLNLEPKAFQGQGSYPAQVRFNIYRECLPLPEDIFKDAIKENYFALKKFNHELTSDQVSKLVALFSPVGAPRKRLPIIPEAEAHQRLLLEHNLSIPGRIEASNRIPPHYRLPPPGAGLEERLSLREPLPRLEHHPLIMDAVERSRLAQTRALDGRVEQKDLLAQGRLEEVDQLALKYLHPGNPSIGRAMDPLHRVPGMAEPPRDIPTLQQETILRNRAMEAERLRRIVAEQATFRDRRW